MCGPALAIVMAVTAAAAAYKQAKTQKGMAEYREQVAKNNATAADWQAQDAVERGTAAAADHHRRVMGHTGAQRASFAARGLDISDGSANAILNDTIYFGEMDENTIRANAARQAWGHKVQGSNFLADAGAYKAEGDSINPFFQAGAAGLSAFAGAKGMGGGQAGGPPLASATAVSPKWYSFDSGGYGMTGSGQTLPTRGGY